MLTSPRILVTAVEQAPADVMEVEESKGAAKTADGAGGATKRETSAADDTAAASATATKAAAAAIGFPEVEVYLSTLALTTLLRHKAIEDAVAIAPALLERAVSFNRRYGSLGFAISPQGGLGFAWVGRCARGYPNTLTCGLS